MPSSAELRVLVLSPTGRDSELVQAMLRRNQIDCLVCSNLQHLCAELDAGAGTALLAEEALLQHGYLSEWIKHQPPWSDLPLLVLTRPGADSATVSQAVSLFGNVTVLERPMRVAALVSSVRSALRARQRQYQIREHLAERERAEMTLRSNDRRKDEFLAILAHELRNPLAPITNGLLLLKLADNREPEVAQIGRMMERQVGNLRRLVDDLLEISRITRSKIELRKELVELAPIIRTAIEASQPLIDAARHRLDVALPESALLLEADPVRLAQVFANLLNNAAKFTEPGGAIGLAVTVQSDCVAVAVSDTGIGIPLDTQSRIFDLFTQADRSLNRAQGGLGIGLTLVRQLVELHDGSVGVSSAGPGMGSEFLVRLPLAAQIPTAATPAMAPAPDAPLTRHCILVVDDNHDAADSLGMVLQMLGATVRIAYSGEQALGTLNGFRPNVAILDIGMRGMDGLELARQIRLRPEFRDTSLIALTGWGQQEDVRATLRSGFNHHLVKPINIEVLEKLLGEQAA